MANKLVFTLSLADLVSAPAKRMQNSLSATSKAMLAENASALTLEKSVTALEKAMVKSAAIGDVKAYQKQTRDLGMLKQALSQTDTSGLRLAESLKGDAAAAGESAEAAGALAGGLAVVGSAAVAAVGGLVALVAAGAKFTLESVHAKVAAIGMFRAMAGGKEAGDQLFGMMEELATQLPQTKDELTAWSKEFTAMGVLNQSALRADLRATASVVALVGKDGAAAFISWTARVTEAANTTGKLKVAQKQLKSLYETGVNVADIARAMGKTEKELSAELVKGAVNARAFGNAMTDALIKKGKGPLDQMWGSMDVLQGKWDELKGDLFEDVDVAPFTNAMRDLMAVFSQAEPSGQAMKAGIGGFFKQFFVWAGQAVLVAKHMFLQLIIWGLKAYIAIKPYTSELKLLVKGALVFAAVIAGALVVALGTLAVALGTLVAPAIATTALILKAYEAWESWGGLSGIVSSAVTAVTATLHGWVASLVAIETEIGVWAINAASSLVDGLVNGVKAGAGLVWDAIRGLGTGAMTALKHVLGIASPSKEFAKLGAFTAKGFTVGLRAENDNAASATEGLARAAADGASRGAAVSPGAAPAASATAPAASSGGVTVQVMPGAIVIHGAAGDASEITEHAVSLIFERVALAQGVAA